MTTITRERLLKIQQWSETYGAGSNVMLPAEEAEELARIALASLEAEPIGAFHIEDQQVSGTTDYIKDGEWPIDNGVIDVYAAPPAPVMPETLPCSVELKPGLIIGKGCKTETLLTALKRRADYYAELEAITPEQRAEHDAGIAEFKAMLEGNNSAAMQSFGNSERLNQAPVKQPSSDDVIGWLRSDYNSDDKRDPDAPLFMLGSNNPSETWGVKYMPLTGNSPVTPDGWISCSERMPEDEQEVIVQNKLGYRYVSYFDEHSGLFFDMRGGNQINCIEHILVTHWMPLPAAPQQGTTNL